MRTCVEETVCEGKRKIGGKGERTRETQEQVAECGGGGVRCQVFPSDWNLGWRWGVEKQEAGVTGKIELCN